MPDNWSRRVLWLTHRYAEGNQSEFARRIGLTPQSVNDLVRGRYEPSTSTLAAICREWPEVNARWLLTGSGSRLRGNTADGQRDGVDVAVRRVESILQELRDTYGLEREP